MGLDRLIMKIVPKDQDHIYMNVKVTEKVKRKDFLIKGAKKLYVLLGPWHGRRDWLDSLRKKVNRKGHSCITYEFPSNIISADYKETAKQYKLTTSQLRKEISEMKKKEKYEKIKIVGISLSGINTILISKNNHDINEILLITPGYDLEESMWSSIRMAEFRKFFQKNKIELKELKKYLDPISPKNNISGLRGKEIKIYLSKADELIPYKQGKELIENLKNKKIDVYVKDNIFFGHYVTIFAFCFFPGKML